MPPGDDPLAQAHATIKRQRAEIERLSELVSEDELAEELRSAFVLGATSRAIVAAVAHERLLEGIVETAARVVGARLGSLFLVDEENQQLVLDVAYGTTAPTVRGLTVPATHGLVGLVATSGQTMAISDASHDPRAARDVAERVGYLPDSMACAPVMQGDRLVGVLELLDKAGAPAFEARDLAVLGRFATLAATALEQSRSHQVFVELIDDVLRAGGSRSDAARAIEERADAFATEIEHDPVYGRSLELARLVQRIVAHGEREFAGCAAILQGFADYLDSRGSPYSNQSGAGQPGEG